MLLKKEVHKNLEKGRQWAASRRSKWKPLASLSPKPPTTTLPTWTISPYFCFSASYSWAEICHYHWLTIRPLTGLSLSRSCFPCEEWRYTRKQSLNLVTFIIPTITRSSETDMWLGATYLTPLIDHQGQSHPSFPSLMKKKSCFLFPRHKNRNQSMFPQKSLSSKNDTITVWNSSKTFQCFKSSITSLTHPPLPLPHPLTQYNLKTF